MIRSPEDVLAMLPVLFGFQPEESLVLVCVPPRPIFHARIDLPEDPDEWRAALDAVLEPAQRHGAHQVFLGVLTDLDSAERWSATVGRGLAVWGMEALDVIAGDGHRWRRLGSGDAPAPYDVWSHPLVARAVLEGRVLMRSRAELNASVGPDPRRVREVVPHLDGSLRARMGDLAEMHEMAEMAEMREMVELVERHRALGAAATPAELARVLSMLQDPAACWAVVEGVPRREARSHLAWWTAVLRAAPEAYAVGPAGVLGFLAWLAGDGALAWCALGRAGSAGDDHPLTRAVTMLLEGAVPPHTWGR